MLAKILVSDLKQRLDEIKKILDQAGIAQNHPDLLYFTDESKLGMEQAKQIIEHFSLKPYSAKGRVVVLEDTDSLTIEAQNALLKTLEELPEEAIFILGSKSDANLLPTVLSRCQIIILNKDVTTSETRQSFTEDIQKLLESTIEDRFEYIEKLKEHKAKEEFLHALTEYFHQNLAFHPSSGNVNFLKELLQAEEWATSNVNLRGILEYLMLVLPTK